MLTKLPIEILQHILEFINVEDLINLTLTNKSLHHLVLTNNIIWKSKWKDKLLIRNRTDERKLEFVSMYHQYRISSNWCKGFYRNKVLIHHNTNYMPWLKICQPEAFLLSVGSELRCYRTDKKGFPINKELNWRLDVPKIKWNDIRTNDISRFVMEENLLICGNRDGSAAVYHINDWNLKPEILNNITNCHKNGLKEVSTVEVINAEMPCAITGSIHDPHLKFWHISREKYSLKVESICVKDVLLQKELGVRCLSLSDKKKQLAIGLNGNSKPYLLDVNTGKLLISHESSINARQTIRDIRWHNPNTITAVTHAGKLQSVDIRTNKVIYDMMDPFQSSLYCVQTDGQHAIVVGTSEYSRCVLFDVRNHVGHVQMYFTQKKSSPVYSLDFDSTKLICAADRSIAALNFNINTSTVSRKDYSQPFEIVSR